MSVVLGMERRLTSVPYISHRAYRILVTGPTGAKYAEGMEMHP